MFQRIAQRARLAVGFREFIRTPIGVDAAAAEIRRQLTAREDNFLNYAKKLIYDVPSSPYRRLLLWAGCKYGDLCASIRSRGLENTLEKLRDEGVYLTLEEFKSRSPISRNGLRIETHETDFDNPFLLRGRLSGETSGSRGKTSLVTYDWDFIAHEAAHEAILYSIHDPGNRPFALWYPVPPGIAGIHNLLMSLKLGSVPAMWFSHSPCGIRETSIETRLALEFVIWSGRIAGLAVPRPTFANLSVSEAAMRWLESTVKKHRRAMLRTFASSAVRLAQTALAIGADLRGGLIFTGGEPLTEPRRRFIESAGLEVYPRYVTTESGLVGAGCPSRSVSDDMHFYSDLLALIHLDRKTSSEEHQPGTLLFTALTMHTPKVLLNVELGDSGDLSSRSCDCAFGKIGLNVHLSNVRSYDKLTIEGMTILTAELDAIIGAAIEKAGGPPDSYQFWEEQDSSGLHRLVVAVSPEVPNLDEGKFIGNIIDELRHGGRRKAMAAEFWAQAASLRVIRESPESTAGHKMHALKRAQASAQGAPDRPV